MHPGKFFVGVLLIFSSACGAELNNKFHASEGFSIRLDNDWIEIPRDVLDQISNTIAERSDVPKQHWNYGYQNINNDGRWGTYPYILIQVHEKGRVAESQLKNYKRLETQFQEEFQKAEAMTSPLMSGITMGETFYDENLHTLLTISKAQVTGVGGITMLIALILTEKGYVQFMGYTLEAESNIYLPLFKEYIENIEFSEKLVYKPRAFGSLAVLSAIDWRQVGLSGLIGGLVAGVFSLITNLRKKASK